MSDNDIWPKHPPNYESIKYFCKKYNKLDESAVGTLVHVMWAARDLIEAFDAHFARHNLSKGRFMILMTLYRQEGGSLSPAELADGCGVTRATVTGLLDTLAAGGLIERVPDATDRRAVQVRLTEAGDKHLETMLPDHYRRIEALMAPLSASERETLVTLMSKVWNGIPGIRNP